MKLDKMSIIESEKKFGTNIKIDVIFVRHGEKDKNSQSLSELGKKQAEDFGLEIEGKDVIKGYTSPIARAAQTVQNIIENSPHDKKLNIRERTELKIPPFSDEMTRKWRESVKNGQDPAEWYLPYGNKRPDEETWSPIEVAESFAYLVDTYSKMADRLYSGSNVDLINGTHSGLPETLLKEVIVREIDGKRVVGFDNISELGGSLKYVEPIKFIISTNKDGDKMLKVNFRNQEYDIDNDRLSELADIYRNKIKSEN